MDRASGTHAGLDMTGMRPHDGSALVNRLARRPMPVPEVPKGPTHPSSWATLRLPRCLRAQRCRDPDSYTTRMKSVTARRRVPSVARTVTRGAGSPSQPRWSATSGFPFAPEKFG